MADPITITSPFGYGWRNLLSGLGFFLYVLVVIEYGFGYQLLRVTVVFGLAIFACGKLFPRNSLQSPYQSIVRPFTSFSELRRAFGNADGFKKLRYKKTPNKRGAAVGQWFCGCPAMLVFVVMSPILLLLLALPNTEPFYSAVVEAKAKP